MPPWSLKIIEPVFENWTDTTPISSPELNIDVVRKTSRNLSHDKVGKVSNVSNVSDIPEMLVREWIVNHEKYKHLFQGISCFKC